MVRTFRWGLAWVSPIHAIANGQTDLTQTQKRPGNFDGHPRRFLREKKPISTLTPRQPTSVFLAGLLMGAAVAFGLSAKYLLDADRRAREVVSQELQVELDRASSWQASTAGCVGLLNDLLYTHRTCLAALGRDGGPTERIPK